MVSVVVSMDVMCGVYWCFGVSIVCGFGRCDVI